jgi:hypothetical protein
VSYAAEAGPHVQVMVRLPVVGMHYMPHRTAWSPAISSAVSKANQCRPREEHLRCATPVAWRGRATTKRTRNVRRGQEFTKQRVQTRRVKGDVRGDALGSVRAAAGQGVLWIVGEWVAVEWGTGGGCAESWGQQLFNPHASAPRIHHLQPAGPGLCRRQPNHQRRRNVKHKWAVARPSLHTAGQGSPMLNGTLTTLGREQQRLWEGIR